MRITYYVQRYRPEFEAISKEVQMLARHFCNEHNVKIHDLHLDGLLNGKWDKKIISYHFAFYPLLFPFTKAMSKNSDINHIYTSLGDLPYLNVLDLQRTILTAAASCSEQKIRKRLKLLHQLPFIVTETEFHKTLLERLGINPHKIKLIYPPVDISSFSHTPTSGNFKILYASCPTREEDFEKRGIFLLSEAAEKEPSVQFLLLWRKGAYDALQKLLKQQPIHNIEVKNEIISSKKEKIEKNEENSMNSIYAKAHCTIIPYTQFDDFLKLIPNSAIESLAAGKPVLVSTKTELARIVQEHKCGVVFEPDVHSLQKAIQELQKNYRKYQQNCQKTAKKLFSKDNFLKEYEQVYASVGRKV